MNWLGHGTLYLFLAHLALLLNQHTYVVTIRVCFLFPPKYLFGITAARTPAPRRPTSIIRGYSGHWINKFVYIFCLSDCVGIALLTFALFMSARMGIYQEVVYARYGKHPSEALFYNVINSAFIVRVHLPLCTFEVLDLLWSYHCSCSGVGSIKCELCWRSLGPRHSTWLYLTVTWPCRYCSFVQHEPNGFGFRGP